MKSVLRPTIILLIATLGLTLAFANSARGWVASRECDPASAIATDALPSALSTPESGLSLGFTMADFTGDRHPDLATLELDGLDSSSATYSIEIRLTEGGRQYLKLTAPFGGLRITPKDVTGDGTLDLVVRAARSHVPVAVFLNDGCGHFSEAAEPADFAQALREVPSESSLTARQLYFGALVISVKSHTVECQVESLRNPQEQNRPGFTAGYRAPSHSFFSFGSNRAPPPVV